MKIPANNKVFICKVARANTCSKFIGYSKKIFEKELSKRP